MERTHERAKRILGAIWRGIPGEYKTKYAFNIWTQFENQVRSASYTTSLSRFVNVVCSKLGASIQDRDVVAFNRAIAAGEDREMLRVLRDEATFCVLLVREENDIRREAWKARNVR